MRLAPVGTLAALVLISSSAGAATITQWNFNSNPADTDLATGTLAPSTGAGTIATIGGVTSTFASGASNGGSSDPATVDDSGLGTTTYPAIDAGDKTAGVRWNVSTVGFDSVVVGYDLRHSNTSSRYEQAQYSIDGTTFVDAAQFDGSAGDTWFNGRSIDLTNVAGVANNPLFAFRVVSTFAPGTSTYAASSTTYGGAGTWRFDQVTVAGSAVPEPTAIATLAAIGGLAVARRRRPTR